ncbi:MAG TPA: hypothetical protein VFW40_04275, partial [Capsulimonadaceae bacterium]|nr:hypothetical protein [Capsulimonadaceae bacterium]
EALARAVLQALSDDKLRNEAAEYNSRLISDRVEYGRCMRRAEAFYDEVLLYKGGEVARAKPPAQVGAV